jgi:hypothetical protein
MRQSRLKYFRIAGDSSAWPAVFHKVRGDAPCLQDGQAAISPSQIDFSAPATPVISPAAKMPGSEAPNWHWSTTHAPSGDSRSQPVICANSTLAQNRN